MATTPHAAEPIGRRRCTNLEVRRLDRALTRHYDRYLTQAGVKNTQYALLSTVLKLGPIRPGDLARQLQMDPSTLTRNLRPLVASGWVSVGPGGDRRTRHVEITEEGAAIRAKAHTAWRRAQDALDEKLGAEHITAMYQLVDEWLTRIG